jgi:hypothetical protein
MGGLILLKSETRQWPIPWKKRRRRGKKKKVMVFGRQILKITPIKQVQFSTLQF